MAEFTSRYTNLDRGENPRNEQSTLFKQLTRLFSGPIASYDKQTARKLKRQSLEKYKNRFKSLSGQSFKKSEHNPFRYLHHERLMNRNRAERYIDFDQMEYSAILGAALDIYADEICTTTQMNDILNINCENERIRSVLRTLYYDILNVQHNLYGWTRTMCKYGDFFLYLDVDEKQGISNAIGLPTHEIERLEGLDENNPNYTQFQWNSAGMTFERWQVCHFRLLGNDKYNPYGTCAAKDTRVDTPHGVKEIQDIEAGDKVYSFDEDKREKVVAEVKDKVCNGTRKVLNIRTKHNYIEVTKNHRILTYDVDEDEFEYKFAGKLTDKDNLVVDGDHEKYIIESIRSIEESREVEVYDIHVEGEEKKYHNFYANGVVVHNSVLEPARRIWRQLVLLEDAVMAYRIVRSPERRVFYIDVGGIDPSNVEEYIQQTVTEFKRHTVVDEDTGQVDLRYDPLCLSGDAKLLKTDGDFEDLETLSQRDLSEESVYVWSLNENNEVVPTRLEWVGKTKEDADLLEIELDDGQKLEMTPDHRLITRDGDIKEAQELEEGDSLMPFYQRYSKNLTNEYSSEDNFYTDIYQPGHTENDDIPEWKTGHKCTAEWKYGEYNCPEVIHHKNHTKYDNSPNNLQKMTQEEHVQEHREQIIKYNKSEEGRKNSSENLKRLWEEGVFSSETAKEQWEDPEIRQKRVDALTFETDYQLPQWVKKAFEHHPKHLRAREYEIREWLNNHEPFKKYLRDLNPDYENGYKDQITKNELREHLREQSIDGVKGMRDILISNLAPWEEILKFCREENPTTRREVIRHLPGGIGRAEFRRIVNKHDMTLQEFDEEFLAQQIIEKQCEACGEWVEVYQSEDDRFCSQECYYESLRGSKKVDYETSKCPTCKDHFERKIRKGKTYCSQECYFNRNNPVHEAPELTKEGPIPDDLRDRVQGGKNHEIVAIREVEENKDVYGVTVENPEHNFAVAGPEAPEFQNVEGVIKSGIFSKNSIEEDYYIPVRGGDSQTRIEKLKGGEYTGDIDDVKYLRDKLLTAIKIPQPYLTYGEDANSEQSSLAQKDIRFARTIQRLQQQVVSQLRKIGVVHLYTLGFDDEDLMAFDLELNNPSRIAEMQELEQWRTKLDVGSMMAEQDVFSDWHVAQNIYDMSEEEFMRNRKEKIHDAKYSKDLTEIEEGGMMDEEGFGGELGGDLEGLEGEEELEEPFGGEGEEPGEEGGLLSAPEGEEEPAKRGDEEYTTPRAKGKKYKPETSDKRDMGARKRSTLSKGGERERGSSRRKKMPGMDAIESLKSGIYEKEKEALEEEKRKEFEKKLSETEQSTKELIKELKKHDSQQET